MQLLFGTLGESRAAADVFATLSVATQDSNGGLAVSSETARELRLGHVARAFATWDDAPRDRSFYLDGEIRSIDGRDTTEGGAGAADRRALADLYESHGADMWGRLDGSFVLIIRDASAFHIGLDVVGTRAVYWWSDGGTLAFHSHLVDLAAAVPGPLSEDLGAIGSFLECGRYAPAETPYREIRHLGAGQCLTFARGEATTREYFALSSIEPRSTKPRRILVDELVALLEASVARCWANASDPVVPLSGGLDSRYIAAELVRQHGRGSVPTITWGEDPGRPGSDGSIARTLAARLGLENTWYEKPQRHTAETFRRALYLSSGESDCAIHYPDDHVIHAALAERGIGSMFRGDECFGATRRLLTDGAVLAVNGIAPLMLDSAYRRLLDGALLDEMGRQQHETIAATLRGLRSRTPTSRRDEVWYGHGVRRFLSPYNRVKHASLEVYTPLLDAAVLRWLRDVPDALRSEKAVFRAALDRRFPDLRDIPYATVSNLPRWEDRARRDPALAAFLFASCSEPGWLDTIGAKDAVLAQLTRMQTDAAGGDAPSRSQRRAVVPREALKRTWPGQIVRELTLERRFASNIPAYLRLARLAVLHVLLAPRAAGSGLAATDGQAALRGAA